MTGTGGGQNKEVMTRTRSYKVEKKIEKCRMRTCAGYASFRKAFYVAASLAIVALMVLTVGFSVQAVGERVYFGSEGYRWNLGTISPIGVYAGADTSFESVEWNVYYDASVLEYVSGGELVEPGVVRVSASGINGNSYMQMLQFVPRVSGSTQIRIGNASVVAADGGRVKFAGCGKCGNPTGRGMRVGGNAGERYAGGWFFYGGDVLCHGSGGAR